MICFKPWKRYLLCKGGWLILKIGLIGIVAVFLALPLKKDKGEFALAIGVMAGMLIFVYILAQISVISDFIKSVLTKLPINNTYLVQLFKMLGITYVADFSSSICKDAGYQSIAGQIEIFGKLSILALSIPGLAYILDLVEQFL